MGLKARVLGFRGWGVGYSDRFGFSSKPFILTDNLLYIGSWEKPTQEKTGLVWVFSLSEKPPQALCKGFYPEPI